MMSRSVVNDVGIEVNAGNSSSFMVQSTLNARWVRDDVSVASSPRPPRLPTRVLTFWVERAAASAQAQASIIALV
jgi:hypothetical protein